MITNNNYIYIRMGPARNQVTRNCGSEFAPYPPPEESCHFVISLNFMTSRPALCSVGDHRLMIHVTNDADDGYTGANCSCYFREHSRSQLVHQSHRCTLLLHAINKNSINKVQCL